jgi:regulator of protease activity HflC (stomatin/prohibitin superfamily)
VIDLLPLPIVAALVAGVALLMAIHVVVVPAGHAYVVERLGRYHRTLAPGLHALVPFLDRVYARHRLTAETLAVPRADCRTRDGAVVAVDAAVTFRIVDAERASYAVADPRVALAQLAQTTLRAEVAGIDLSEANASRAAIDRAAADRLARTAEAWGLAVLGHEITDVNRQWKETHA